MSRLSPPVLATAGQTRTRVAQPRVANRRRTGAAVPSTETLGPSAFKPNPYLEHAQHQLVQDGSEDLARELHRLRRSTERLERSEDVRGSASLSTHVKLVQARIDRLERILDELATAAAIQAHTLEIQPQRVNLVPLVGRIVAGHRSRGTTCKLNVAMPQGLTAMADPVRIEQALRRNPRGCWVDVELRRPLVGLARLEVRDFARTITDRSRLRQSTRTDRGLLLSRYIVERHGGTLSIEFPIDGGVRVVVVLPTQRGRVRAGSTPRGAVG
jgi:signal transduction histidine kinase